MLHRVGDVLALTVFLLVLITIGILKHLLHHIGLTTQRMTEHRKSLSHSHRESRLLTIACQPREYQMRAAFLLSDAHHVVVGLREAILIDKVHRVRVVDARHQTVLLLGIECHGLHGLRHIRAIGVEGLCRRIIV